MYLEIENLTQEELDDICVILKNPNRIRMIQNIYTEVCRVEAECTLDMLIAEGSIGEMSFTQIQEKAEEISLEIACECENRAFQELAEIADEVTRGHCFSI